MTRAFVGARRARQVRRRRSGTCSAESPGSGRDAHALPSCVAQLREGRGIVVVAVDVAQQRRRASRTRPASSAAVLRHARPRALDELVAGPARVGRRRRSGTSGARGAPSPAARERSSCRRDRRWRRRRRSASDAAACRCSSLLRRGRRSRSAWPTAPCSGSRSWPRDAKRSKSAAVSTCAGTPASLAACDRPSPFARVRDACPANASSVGSDGERLRP